MSGLSIRGLVVDRVGQPVVRGVDCEVPLGEVTVLLGANGAGKSTMLDGISGVAPISAGGMVLGGQSIAKASRSARVRSGLAYVQQGRAIFPGLTVEENFLVTAPRNQFDVALELFPELEKRMDSKTALLSGGEQQMVVLARALLQKPTVLLLDELSLGLAPIVVDRMLAAVKLMAHAGMAILLVEQFAHKALAIGDTAMVMTRGEMVLVQPAAELVKDPELVKAAYLSAATT